MIKTRGRKIIRDVLARKGRTAMVAISIMIGVFGAVTLMSANDLLITQIKKDINPDEIAMLRLFVSVPTANTDVTIQIDDGTVDDQVLHLVRSNIDAEQPVAGTVGVTHIEGQVVAPVFWQKAETDDKGYEEGDLMAYSEPLDQIGLEPMRKVRGEWPRPGVGFNEIAIERRMADEYDLDLGDQIVFRSLGGTTETTVWTITAIAFHPYWVETGDFNTPERRIFAASVEDAHRMTSFSGYSTFYLRYIDTDAAEEQAPSLEETIREQTNYIPQGSWLDDPDNYFLIGEVQQVTNVLNMLAVVALVVSGFLVTNVINTIVLEQKQQVGVMKSLGATRLDNFTIYAGVALVYGVIGTIPGLILGMIAGSMMAQAVAPLASTLIEGFNVSLSSVIVGAVMGLLVPMVAAFIPVFNGTRVTILEAITDLGISGTWGKGPMARIIAALPLSPNIRQALSNVVQKKGRLALTVITLTLAAAAFMGVFAMFTVISDEIAKIFDTFGYEAIVIPTEPQDFNQVRDLMVGNPEQGIPPVEGVEGVYPGIVFEIKLFDLSGTAIVIGSENEEDPLQGIGFQPGSPSFDFTYDDGHGFEDDDPTVDPNLPRVLLTSSTARAANKKVNDSINISAGGKTRRFKIIGLVSYPFDLAFMQWQDLARLAGFVDDRGTPDDATDDIPLPTAFYVDLDDEHEKAGEVDGFVDTVSEVMLNNGITANYSNQVKEQEDTADRILVFGMIFQITSAVMAAVGAIGLLTTLSMAVYERQKEIGVMRSIGAGSSTIATQFLIEGIVIGVLSWLLAVPLSYLLANSLMNALEFSDFIEFSYPVWVLGLGLVGMVAIAFVASLWPSIAASRKTVSDILRYQ